MPARKVTPLDFSKFPPGTVTEYSTLVCLACIFDIFTSQLGLAPRTAYAEIKRYAPTVNELTAPNAVRPFFDSEERNPHCPYCNAAKRWHARLDTYGIESSKAGDAVRREFLRTLAKKKEQFLVLETKTERRNVFFAWLDTLGLQLDLDEEGWLIAAARAYLERLEPKTDWSSVFADLKSIRRSSKIADGWEREGSRLFLAPPLYSEVLVVQYLVSRSHAHGGHTLEGRLTIAELIRRMRYFGYLNLLEVSEDDQFDILETVVEKLAGGKGSVRVFHVVDRRDFLEKVKSVYARYA